MKLPIRVALSLAVFAAFLLLGGFLVGYGVASPVAGLLIWVMGIALMLVTFTKTGGSNE